jgi:predicted nucleic acid-binding protein
VTHLLDVNVLLALRYATHVHHLRALHWCRSLNLAARNGRQLATCPITEMGFVRVACGPAAFSFDVSAACVELKRLKDSLPFVFFRDGLGAARLPDWVTRSKQTTDGHLLQLASSYGATFATLDSGIPGALLIPGLPDDASRVSEPRVTYGAAA